MIRVLHISDLHYHTSGHHGFSLPKHFLPQEDLRADRPTMVDAITDAVKGITRIDGIIVTGDLTWGATAQEYDCAEQELLRLQALLNVTKEHVLLIPGNHDAHWDKDKSIRFSGFAKLFNNVTGCALSDQDFTSTVNIGDGAINVRFLGVNSATIESMEDQGIGLVGVEMLKQFLQTTTSDANPEIMPVTILCMHHHILPVAYVENDYFKNNKKRTSVTLDAKAILHLCGRYRVGMVLHGHQHQPSLVRYEAFDPLEQKPIAKNPIWASGCGSTGVENKHLGDINRRHFQVLEFERTHDAVMCHVISFASSPTIQYEFDAAGSARLTLNSKAESDVGYSIMNLENAQASLIKRLNDLAANEIIEIQHIGLDMFTAKNKLLEMLNRGLPAKNATVNILVVTEDLKELQQQFGELVPHAVEQMPGKVKESVNHIYDDLEAVVDRKCRQRGMQLTVNIRRYKRLPSIHGFSLLAGPRTKQRRVATYCSFFRWIKRETSKKPSYWDYDWGGAEHKDSYRYIPGDANDASSQDMIAIFQGEFDHLWDNSEMVREPVVCGE